jgi:hypothetical protein
MGYAAGVPRRPLRALPLDEEREVVEAFKLAETM